VKIAQISPLCEAVPPRLYGGTERVVAHLCDALVQAGHDVTLFAAADARTRARLVPMRDQAIRLDPAPHKCELAAHLSMLHEVRRHAEQFDLLHFHTDLLHFPLFEHCAAKTLTTLHGRLDLKDLPATLQAWPQFPLVAISARQQLQLPAANWLGVVHHGLPLSLYPFSARARGGYLAFLGRASPEKRLDRAIAIAARAGLPLKIAAKVDDADRSYFNARIAPLLDTPGVEFIGEIDDSAKGDFLGQALALLFPIDWPEPFGLAMIEALACGTPVVAWDCGSVAELIDDGVTGRIVRSRDEAVAAVSEVCRYDRRRIRAGFERRFSASAMADGYIELYWRLAQAGEVALRRSA
jgi:glycosyltransferase involved in cell wall biosynthesis